MTEYLGDKLIKGSLWTIAMRFSMRAMGFINTIILARLLNPEDFGIIAISMLVIGLITIFSSTGMNHAILRRKEIDDDLVNTAWTLNIIIGLLLSSAIFFSASFASIYFNEPRIEPILKFLAINPLLKSFSNIGLVFFAKNLEFNKAFIRVFTTKLLSVSIGIGIALWLRNYWALAYGMVVGETVGVITSYLMHPYRPKISLKQRKQLFTDVNNSISKNIAIFLKQKADEFFIGSLSGANALGGYYIAKSVTNMLTAEIVQPTSQALLPGYSKMADDLVRQRKAIHKVLKTIAIIALPTSFGIAGIAEYFTAIVFGEKWGHITPYFIIFSFIGGLTALQSVTGPVLMAKGKLKQFSYLSWFTLISFVLAIWPIALKKDVLLIAMTILTLGFLYTLVNLLILYKYVRLRLKDIFCAIFEPLLAATLMYYFIKFVSNHWLYDISISNLLALITIGIIIYTMLIIFIWLVNKKPDGIESFIFNKINN